MNSQEETVRILRIITGEVEDTEDEFNEDDLREHDWEDIKNKFSYLNEHDVWVIYLSIRSVAEQFQDVYRLDARDEKICRSFLETVQEDIHGDFYGEWSEYQRYVIQAWLHDVGEGTRADLEHRGEKRPYRNIVGEGRQ